MESSQFIKVAVLENMIEAQLVESVLKDQGIPHRVRSFHDTAYDGLFQLQKGWGEIYAPPSRQKDVEDILKDIRAQAE
jgi:hypothetical protein